jgi:hypothetical protein
MFPQLWFCILVLSHTWTSSGLPGQATLEQQSPKPDLHCDWHENEGLDAKYALATTKQLSSADKARPSETIAAQLRQRMNHMEIKSENSLRTLVGETRIKAIDLNGDGKAEVIAQFVGPQFCSPTGNCSRSVFEDTPAGYREILSTDSFQSFNIADQRTQGFRNILFSRHGSATSSELYEFRYIKGKYRRDGCYTAHWVERVGDERHEWAPKVTHA